MIRHPRMKYSSSGDWNRVQPNKIFIEQNSIEPKVKVLFPMYAPLEVAKCRKCGRVLAEPKELIDFWKTQEKYRD